MVFHVELRRFPYKACSYNLSEVELRGKVLEPWVEEGWVSMGEREWNAHEATLRILEGPEIEITQISLGRGWKSAEREGRDVTAQMIAAAGQGSRGKGGPAVADRSGDGGEGRRMLADSLGLELLGALGEDGLPLSDAWSRAAARLGGGTPSASLALAEEAVRSLLGARLLALSVVGAGEGPGKGLSAGGDGGAGDGLLSAPESWGTASNGARVWLMRL